MKAFATIILLAGCAAISPVPVPLAGDWGGPHIGLHLAPAGGTIEYDCASGTIAPILPGSGGGFTADGTHTPGHGGPVREGEVMPTYRVVFTGRVRGDRMTLEGRIENGIALGPFELRRGGEPGIFRCL